MEKRDIPQNGLLVVGLAATSFLAGCDKSADQWSNAPGTQGLINLDAVKQAFIKDPNVAQFETRVNEIFEGDKLIICTSKPISGGFQLSGTEDLDADREVSKKDEVLFTLTVAKGRAILQGNSINGYYKESWPYSPPKKEEYSRAPSTYRHYPHFHYWYWGRGWGGYYTPRSRYSSIFSHRNDYRGGSGYSSQIAQNTSFENRMASKYGAGFRSAVGGVGSPVRRDYINTTKNAPGFKDSLKSNQKSSAWSQRSKSATSSSFRSVKNSRGSTYSKSGRSGSSGFRGHRGSSGFGV